MMGVRTMLTKLGAGELPWWFTGEEFALQCIAWVQFLVEELRSHVPLSS